MYRLFTVHFEIAEHNLYVPLYGVVASTHGSDDNRLKSFLLSIVSEISLEADSAASELYHSSLLLLTYFSLVAGDCGVYITVHGGYPALFVASTEAHALTSDNADH